MNETTALPNTTQAAAAQPGQRDHTVGQANAEAQHIWNHVSHSPVSNLWNFEGAPASLILKRSAKAFMDDNLVSRFSRRC